MSGLPPPTVLLEGFLQKQSGGLFLKKKQKWAVLRSDGTLSLSRKPELPASSVIHMYELDEMTYRDEDCSISFSSVYNGSIIKAYKFYALETPTFEDWTDALDKLRDHPSPAYADSRSKFVRETMSAFPVSRKDSGVARVTVTDEELEQQVDPILLIQSSGEAVSKAGYIKKRGGAYGGNTSYKKRFFVLTICGRVVYFADHKKTQALGQFSLENATIQHSKMQEVSVVTPTRVWFLKFDTEASRLEWTEKLEAVALLNSQPPSPDKSSSNFISQDSNAPTSTAPPRFRRNMSLLVRQKSNFDGLGFSNLHEKEKSPENDFNALPEPPSVQKEPSLAEVSVACVTWNLSESLPKMQQCRFLRQYRKHQIVVVGVQECQSVMYHSFSARQLSPLDIWLAMVKSLMGDPFTLVASRSMGAIHVCVFVREDVIGSISDVNTAFVPCGLGNVMYNKGAVAVSLKCNQTSFVFVCAHLAANLEKTMERNQDFHRISLLVVEQLGRAACVERRRDSVLALEKNKTRRQAGLYTVVGQEEEFVYTDDDPSTPINPPNHSVHLLHQSGRFQAVGGGVGSSGVGGGGSGAQVDSLDSLAREFDRCFFLGDLNYRVDAGKEWVELYLKMAEQMRQLEKREREQEGCSDELTSTSVSPSQVPEPELTTLDDDEDDVRTSEKKIEKVGNIFLMFFFL